MAQKGGSAGKNKAGGVETTPTPIDLREALEEIGRAHV